MKRLSYGFMAWMVLLLVQNACAGSRDISLGHEPSTGGSSSTDSTGTGGTSSAGSSTGGTQTGGTSNAGSNTGGTQAIVPTTDANTIITLERTACFGSCPVYTLELKGDGSVTYDGRQYVTVIGTATGQVDASAVYALASQMIAADYFNLTVPTTCPQGIATDNPTVTTSLTVPGYTHRVENYHGNQCAPAVLRTLENAIDSTAQSAPWVGCGNVGIYCGS